MSDVWFSHIIEICKTSDFVKLISFANFIQFPFPEGYRLIVDVLDTFFNSVSHFLQFFLHNIMNKYTKTRKTYRFNPYWIKPIPAMKPEYGLAIRLFAETILLEDLPRL